MPINKKEYLCLGLLAHVDAGKTTLSEALLHRTGAIRSAGRVDHGDAFLDTNVMERDRGITIFSREVQCPKASSPMLVSVSGRVTLVSLAPLAAR